MRRPRRRNQRGFALLLVFALAAAALVMLYLEMPRVAFEHQRDKEALLIDRGEEYVRAIQLYVQKFQKYPQSIEDLESANNVRFLRKRFRDPVTGEEEWRLIHIDAAGQYTDSLVHKRQEQKRESSTHVLQAAVQGIGASAEVVAPDLQSQASNPALRRTASDRIIPGLNPGQGSPASPAGEEDPAPQAQAQPVSPDAPPQQGMQPPPVEESGNPPPVPVQSGGFRMPGNVPVPPGQQPSPAAPPSIGYGGGIGSPSASPPPAPSVTGGMIPGMVPPQQPRSGFPGPAPGMGSPAAAGAGSSNPALQAIQRILTRQQAGAQQPSGGMMLGGGIAGVASKADLEGIRTYNDRTNYKEWEFLFDFRKAMQAAGLGTGQGQQQPAQGSGRPANPFERPAGASGFGGSGFGGSGFGSGFGNRPQPAPPVRP